MVSETLQLDADRVAATKEGPSRTFAMQIRDSANVSKGSQA